MSYYKKILFALLAIVVSLCFIAIIHANAVSCAVKKPIIFNEHVVFQQPPSFVKVIEPFDCSSISLTTPNYSIENDVVQIDSFSESKNQKLYELVDLWNFKPSYNMVVTQALIRVGEQKDRFVGWHKNEIDATISDDDWSLQFLQWCVEQSDAHDAIPTVSDLNGIITFFKEQERYYPRCENYIPQVGDLILIDEDLNGIADRISIVSFYYNGTATIQTVGGCVWSAETNAYIVQEEKYFIGDNAIVGFCNPYYGITPDVTFSSPEIVFNGVDTVAYLSKPEYAEILASNGIEVIARYINPEGRCPLDIAEAQRYSDAGIRIMMIYQINTSDPYKGYDTGYLFGSRALKYAKKLQAPKGTPIFFCCDTACDFENFDKVAQFILGVKDAMQGEYGVGLYGGYFINEAMYNLGLIDAHWQSYGFNRGYLSPNMDMFQSSCSTYFFSEIPIPFDSNYVKNPEKVSYIMPKSTEVSIENIHNHPN